MRTVVFCKGGWSWAVEQTVDDVTELMTQPGPFGLIDLNLKDSDVKVHVDAHSIVAVSEIPGE